MRLFNLKALPIKNAQDRFQIMAAFQDKSARRDDAVLALLIS